MATSSSKLYGCCLGVAIAFAFSGCQGISKSPAAPVSVSLNESSVSVGVNATTQFSATVQGTSNTAVTWSVDSVTGGNSSVGTISAGGLYTAPSQAGAHVVAATSVADPTKSASANVTVVQFSISPTSATLSPGATQQFTASQSANWSVDGVAGGNATTGTITSAGLYTAPSIAGTHTVTGTATGNAKLSASATVTISQLTISPTSATLSPGGTQQFTASGPATWSVDGVSGGNSTTGTITSGGLYTAPTAAGNHTVTATSTTDPKDTATATVTVVAASQGAVLTYHNDNARDGAFTEETILMPSNVNSTLFGKLLSYPVDGQVYAQPLYMSQLNINGAKHDVVFVVTQNNSVYAFDAGASNPQGAHTFWQINLGPHVTKNDISGVNPYVGILSTPVIDPTTNTVYLVAEVTGTTDPTPFYLHALDVTTGKEKFGGPVNINGSVTGTEGTGSSHTIPLDPSCYQRMGLALNPVTGDIYIPFGSCPHGWVLAYNKTSLQQTAIFNDTPDDNGGGGLWSSGGAVAIDDSTGNLYLMSGVDAGDQITTGYNDSFLRLDATNLSVLDYFTPDNAMTLAQNDADLGSGSNILMPNNSSNTPHETIGGGKDGNVFVVNRDNMGAFGTTNDVIQTIHIGTQQYNNIFSTPVYWNGSLYFHSDADVLHAFSWSSTTGMLSGPTSSASTVYNVHGATPSLSSNGNANGIVWDIDNSAYNKNNPSQSGPSVLHAYDASDAGNELYNSSQAGSRDTAGAALKFTVPTIVGGRVFVPTTNELDIYGLLP